MTVTTAKRVILDISEAEACRLEVILQEANAAADGTRTPNLSPADRNFADSLRVELQEAIRR